MSNDGEMLSELAKRLEATQAELAELKASIRATPTTGQVDLHGMWLGEYARRRGSDAALTDISDICVEALKAHRTPEDAQDAVRAIAKVYDRWLERRQP
jgi:hypothetical protein